MKLKRELKTIHREVRFRPSVKEQLEKLAIHYDKTEAATIEFLIIKEADEKGIKNETSL